MKLQWTTIKDYSFIQFDYDLNQARSFICLQISQDNVGLSVYTLNCCYSYYFSNKFFWVTNNEGQFIVKSKKDEY